MGCCEGRDSKLPKYDPNSSLQILKSLSKLKQEASTLRITHFDKIAYAELLEKIVHLQKITKDRNWKQITSSDKLKIESHKDKDKNNRYSPGCRIIKIIINLHIAISLKPILNSICSFEHRKK